MKGENIAKNFQEDQKKKKKKITFFTVNLLLIAVI